MRCLVITWIGAMLSLTLFAQNDRGTITGAVVDQAGAVVPGVEVVARNTETQVAYRTATTSSGDYTIEGVPIGIYGVTITAQGFNTFTQTGIRIYVGQTARVDAKLVVGDSKQEVTITGEAPLLKPETSDQSFNVPVEQLDNLPLNFGANGNSSSANIRNPYTFINLVPSGSVSSYSTIRLNGAPINTFYVNVEGQQANNNRLAIRQDQVQPSVESLEEMSVVTSNFAPEFGQVAGGYINLVTKSGTNQFHGSLFEYLVNEDLGAGQPFTNGGNGHLLRPPNRRDDFGGSIGGPVWIPKVYNGRNKTFFFFTNEQFYQKQVTSGVLQTVPTALMRAGNFSEAITQAGSKVIGTDPMQRSIVANTIYDPLTARSVSGQSVTDPFPGNIIPSSRLDPVALKIQALIPPPTYPGTINNWDQIYNQITTEWIPSIKIDENLTNNDKLSFYYSGYSGPHYNGSDGLPVPITQVRHIDTLSRTWRVNYDRTITPTLLLHAGLGFLRHVNPDLSVPGSLSYNPVTGLGLTGAVFDTGFPGISMLNSPTGGGMALPMGTVGGPIFLNKPTAVLNVTYVRGTHTYKTGLDARVDALTQDNITGDNGLYTFNLAQTSLPYLQGAALAGNTVGLPYASFLLGDVYTASISNPTAPQARKLAVGLFVEDQWKLTRKLTLTYGLRWDFQEYPDEIHARESQFSPTTPNPSAGGLPGGIISEGSAPGACNCRFSHTYPSAIGPRLGGAYLIDPKTVLRGGWGVTYAQTASGQSAPISFLGTGGWNSINFSNPTYGAPALQLQNGLNYNLAQLYNTTLNPGLYPQPGQINNPPAILDINAARPPRMTQWNISLQRQITPTLLIEAAYVGNRGVWFEADTLVNPNAISAQRLASFGLSLNNPANVALLTMPLNSSAVSAAGFKAPYAGFPTTATLAQALRPFPQMGTIAEIGAPLGNTYYDALQAKLTKRLSHGLDMQANFVWQKELDDNEVVNDVFNRANQKTLSSLSQPLATVVSFNYQVPPPTFVKNRWVQAVARDWTLGGIFKYASGLPILAPVAQNNLSAALFQSTYATRVSGQPLFLKDLNCNCIDPNSQLVLNPAAWSQPAAGQFGQSAPYFNDYRQARTPSEQLSLGRLFRIRERMSFQIRAEFFNAFNRVELGVPISTNSLQATTHNSAGLLTAGFGYINPTVLTNPPRNGQIVARFQF